MVDVVRNIVIRVSAEGASQAAAQLDNVADAQQNVASSQRQMGDAAARTGPATLSSTSALERLRRQLDANYSAQQRFAAAQNVLNRSFALGLIDQRTQERLLGQARQRLDETTRAQQGYTNQTKLTRYELINLSRQVQDVGVGLASGQRLFTILIQQGTQIADVFAASRASFSGVVSQIAAMLTPMRVLGLLTAAVGAAALLATNSWKNFALQLDDAAKSAGITADQMNKLQGLGAREGIGRDEMTKAMERFAEASRDAQRQTGALGQELRAAGFRVGNFQQNLENLARLMQGMNEVQQRNLLRAAGLPTDQNFIRFMEALSKGFDKATAGVKTLGDTMDKEMIARAREFDRQWNTFTDNFTIRVKSMTATVIKETAETLRIYKEFFEALMNLPGIKQLSAVTSFITENLGKVPRNLPIVGPIVRSGEIIEKLTRPETPAAKPTVPTEKEIDKMTESLRYLTLTQKVATRTQVEAMTEDERSRVAKIALKRALQEEAEKRKELADAAQREADSKPKTAAEQIEELERQNRLIRAKGETASIDERVKAVENDLLIQQIQLQQPMQDTIDKVTRLARIREESARFQVRAGLEVLTIEDALQDAENKLNEALLTGAITAKEAAAARATLVNRSLEMIPLFRDLKSAGENFLTSFITGISNGTNAVDALLNSLNALGNQLISLGTKDTLKGLTSVLSGGEFGTGGLIGLGMTAVGFAINLFTNKSKKAREEAQRAQEAAKQAQQAWEDMQDQVNDFIDTMSGLKRGPFAQAIHDAKRQMEEFMKAIPGAQQASSKVLNTLTRSFGVDLQKSVAGSADAVRISQAFSKGVQRIVDEAMRGTPVLSETEQQIAETIGKFDGLAEALVEAGRSSAEASSIMQYSISNSLLQLGQRIGMDLQRELNQALGRDYVNQIQDLVQKYTDLASHAQELGLDLTLLGRWFGVTAQGIVDSSQLTGQAFQELLTMFPLLAGNVREFSETVKRSVRDLAEAQKDLQNRLFAATNDTNTLAGALAAFDRQANEERQAEIEAGGENILLLEQVLAAERMDIISEFNDRALEEISRAVEDQLRVLKEAQDALDAFSHKIHEFVVGLRAGTQSPLSPAARLAEAQAAFDQQVAIIQTGTAAEQRAAMDTITTYAQTLLEAQRAFSPATFGSAMESVIATLESLPAQIDVQELILDAIQTMNTDLVTALQTGNLLTIAQALSTHLPLIDTNTDNTISFDEMLAALGSNFSTGTLQSIFTELDINGDGMLSATELNRQQLVGINNEADVQTNYLSATYSLTSSINFLMDSINTLSSFINQSSASSAQLLASINQISSSSQQLLETIRQQLSDASVTGAIGGGFTGNTVVTVQNNMLQALNKIVFNTGLTANNTGRTATVFPSPFVNSGYSPGGPLFHAGGFIQGGEGPKNITALAGEFVVRREVARRYAAHLQNLNAGVPANDNAELVAEIKALRSEVESLKRVSASGHAMVREGIDVLAYSANEAAAEQKLRSVRQ